MGISGQFVQNFGDANLASAVGVHMNGDYHFFFDIVEIYGRRIKLKSHRDGSIFDLQVKRSKDGFQFVTYEHYGIYSQLISKKQERIKVVPFKGERF